MIEIYNSKTLYFHFRTQKLLNMATNVSSRIFRTRPALDSLVCYYSRIVLVGEAAHPLLVRHSITSLLLILSLEIARRTSFYGPVN